MAETNEKTPATNEGNANSDNKGGTNAQGGGNSSKTYTQEEVNRFVTEREERAAKAALKDFYQKQGLTEDEANQAIKTFLDEKKKNSPEAVNGQLSQQLAETQKELAKERLHNVAEKAARTLGADEKSIDYIVRLTDFTDSVNDGEISVEKVNEAVKKVMDDIPAFKKAENESGVKVGGDGEQKDKSDKDKTQQNTPKRRWNRFNL
jgi:hypothetical protein